MKHRTLSKTGLFFLSFFCAGVFFGRPAQALIPVIDLSAISNMISQVTQFKDKIESLVQSGRQMVSQIEGTFGPAISLAKNLKGKIDDAVAIANLVADKAAQANSIKKDIEQMTKDIAATKDRIVDYGNKIKALPATKVEELKQSYNSLTNQMAIEKSKYDISSQDVANLKEQLSRAAVGSVMFRDTEIALAAAQKTADEQKAKYESIFAQQKEAASKYTSENDLFTKDYAEFQSKLSSEKDNLSRMQAKIPELKARLGELVNFKATGSQSLLVAKARESVTLPNGIDYVLQDLGLKTENAKNPDTVRKFLDEKVLPIANLDPHEYVERRNLIEAQAKRKTYELLAAVTMSEAELAGEDKFFEKLTEKDKDMSTTFEQVDYNTNVLLAIRQELVTQRNLMVKAAAATAWGSIVDERQ